MSSLIDYLMEKDGGKGLSCQRTDCLYNEGGKCTQGVTCVRDEHYDKAWFKENEKQNCN